jgi:hypothetical protein
MALAIEQAKAGLSPNARDVYSQSCEDFVSSLCACYPGNPQNYVPLSPDEMLTRLRVLWELGYDYGADAVRAKRDEGKSP